MKPKHKRLLSIIVTLCMVLTLSPAFSLAAFASDADAITIIGVIDSANSNPSEPGDIGGPGDFTDPDGDSDTKQGGTEPADEIIDGDLDADVESEEKQLEENGLDEISEACELCELDELCELCKPEVIAAISGVTISGWVISNNPGIATTIELIQDSEVKYSTVIEASDGTGQVTQEYSFEGVEAGTYTLKVTKKAHLSYTMLTLTVDEENVTYFEVTLRPGDLNGDGVIDLQDLYLLINKYGQTSEVEMELLADLNGDGIVDENDLAILMAGLGSAEVIDL